MRGFLTKLVGFAAVHAALLALLIGLFCRPARDHAVFASTLVKHHRLAHAPSPWAIFVGGSNIFSSLDSAMVAEQTRYEPVNMGLVIGLHLAYMLDEVRPGVRAGDLVVVCLEYQQMYMPFYENPQGVDCLAWVFRTRPQSAATWRWMHWRAMLDTGLVMALGDTTRAAWDNAWQIVRGRPLPEPEARINAWGDLITHRDRTRHQNFLPAGFGPEIPGAETDRQVRLVNAFVADCRARGADVVFAYPPMGQSTYDQYQEVLEAHDARLRAALDCEVVQRPVDGVVPDDWLYNSDYHLRGSGVPERTRRLIEAIQRYDATAQDARPDQAPADTP